MVASATANEAFLSTARDYVHLRNKNDVDGVLALVTDDIVLEVSSSIKPITTARTRRAPD